MGGRHLVLGLCVLKTDMKNVSLSAIFYVTLQKMDKIAIMYFCKTFKKKN